MYPGYIETCDMSKKGIGQAMQPDKRIVFRAPSRLSLPRGSIYATIMELGSQNHNKDGLLGPNSIMVVYMEPLGYWTT